MAELTHRRLDAGHAPGEASQLLVDDGLPRDLAARVVDLVVQSRLEGGRGSRARRVGSEGTNNTIFGSLWLVGGVIVTAATASSGNTVIVAYGAIIGGLVQSVYGIVQRTGLKRSPGGLDARG
jgi:hypothetical protein